MGSNEVDNAERRTASAYPDAPTLLETNQFLVADAAKWPKAYACPVCLSKRIRRFSVIRHIQHSRCSDCGLVFADPFPPDEVTGNFYNSAFYANYRRAENDRAQTEPYYMISMYTDKYSLAERVAAKHPKSVLDYGCGSGAFLALLRDKYKVPYVEGLEISEPGRRVAVERYSLDVAPSPEKLKHASYDFVLLLEVIEHIPNPADFFATVSEKVRSGGYILVTTPAVDSLIGRMAQLCQHYTAPSHVSLFTVKALQILFDRFGFVDVDLVTDPARGLARRSATGLFYGLDFASPKDQADENDSWYRPNALGRTLGLKAGRDPFQDWNRIARSMIGRVDRGLDRFPLGTDHLYAIARKKLAALQRLARRSRPTPWPRRMMPSAR